MRLKPIFMMKWQAERGLIGTIIKVQPAIIQLCRLLGNYALLKEITAS